MGERSGIMSKNKIQKQIVCYLIFCIFFNDEMIHDDTLKEKEFVVKFGF